MVFHQVVVSAVDMELPPPVTVLVVEEEVSALDMEHLHQDMEQEVVVVTMLHQAVVHLSMFTSKVRVVLTMEEVVEVVLLVVFLLLFCLLVLLLFWEVWDYSHLVLYSQLSLLEGNNKEL